MAELFGKCTTLATFTAKGFQGKKLGQMPVALPMMTEKSWTVSVLTRGPFRHHSLLFECSRGIAFYVDLYVIKEKEVTLRANEFDFNDEKYEGLTKKYLGKITATAADILETAEEVLKEFGTYYALLNNCQVSIQVRA